MKHQAIKFPPIWFTIWFCFIWEFLCSTFFFFFLIINFINYIQRIHRAGIVEYSKQWRRLIFIYLLKSYFTYFCVYYTLHAHDLLLKNKYFFIKRKKKRKIPGFKPNYPVYSDLAKFSSSFFSPLHFLFLFDPSRPERKKSLFHQRTATLFWLPPICNLWTKNKNSARNKVVRKLK